MQPILNRMHRRVQSLVGTGRTTAIAKDDGGAQTIQIAMRLDGVIRDATDISQFYGFSSSPPVGTDVILLPLTGDRGSAVIIAHGNQSARRKGLASGEASLHAFGAEVHMSANGIVIDGGGKSVTVQNMGSGTLTVVGNVSVSGTITVQGDVISGDNAVSLNGHRHESFGPNMTTSQPI